MERPFAHLYETGGMRRVYLRGHPNILKRLLIHTGGFNLGLLMRTLYTVGTPRSLQDGAFAFLVMLNACFAPDTHQTETLEGTSGQHEKQISDSSPLSKHFCCF